MTGWLISEFWPLILGGLGLIAGWLGFKSYGASQRKAGRKEAEHDALKDTLDRVDKGRKAVRDGRDADPDDRLRDNDERW